jgi:hypothetical protein
VRVSCGWPSSRGLSTKSRAVGECWPGDASSDGKNQIFVSPFCSTGTAPSEVLATLVHEVVHAVVGLENKHGKAFKKCALAVGLDGKMTSTTAGPDLMVTIGEWEKQLGPYPHSPLNPLRRPTKKQGVRMLKMTCKECGYVARTAKKWLDEAGPCHCPKHGVMDVEPKETEDESE